MYIYCRIRSRDLKKNQLYMNKQNYFLQDESLFCVIRKQIRLAHSGDKQKFLVKHICSVQYT